jgi:hypothetical protein
MPDEKNARKKRKEARCDMQWALSFQGHVTTFVTNVPHDGSYYFDKKRPEP